MLKSFKKLLHRSPLKGKAKYVKKLFASNIAFIAIALPAVPSLPNIDIPDIPNSDVSFSAPSQANLIIPQSQLDKSFNIANKPDETTIQIPIDYIYMSQGYSTFHPAIDLATDNKTPIKPIKAGTVVVADYSPFGYGNEIIIDHGDGMQSLYAHLSKIYIHTGQIVTLDTTIGLVGTTGHSTGPHLHLEIRKDGKNINPLSILPKIIQGQRLLTSK
jgi:murein DD-endopeptidase MepM/ murein hydrolase activator NlpD